MTCVMTALPVTAMEQEDSVSIINNWEPGDYQEYLFNAGRLLIHGNDTIIERESPETITRIQLLDELENGDKIFAFSTRYSDLSKMAKAMSGNESISVVSAEPNQPKQTADNSKEKLYEQFLKLQEMPIKILTDFSGEVKDIYDYDSLHASMDSCFDKLKGDIASNDDIAGGNKLSLLLNFQKMWNKLISKEALMSGCALFRYFGYTYPFGTSISHEKLPLLTGDCEVDATATFSCSSGVTDTGLRLIEISSVISYDSDQVTEYLMSSLLSDEQKASTTLDNPDRPFISMLTTEIMYFEPESGTVVEYLLDKRTTTPDETIIDYSVYRLTQD